MSRAEELNWWQTVFIHEAGHCVAAAARYMRFHAITAQNDPNDCSSPKKASCDIKPPLTDFSTRPEDFLVVLCGGAAAEKLLLGVESQGFDGDKAKLFKLPPIGSVEARERFHSLAQDEIAAGFPRTTQLLRRHLSALNAIANESLRNLECAGLIGCTFERMEVLAADAVKTLFERHPPVAH